MLVEVSRVVQDLCADVPAAKQLFDQASEILGYDLLQICTEGASSRWHTVNYTLKLAEAFEHPIASSSIPYHGRPDQ